MKLAFYKVDNSLNYERHTFDSISDNPQLIEEKLQPLLDKDEAAIVAVEDFESLLLFQEEFNDAVYDGGWWSVVLQGQELRGKEVYLIVQRKPVTKVFARIFDSYEKAVEAMNECDEETGEKLYPDCHIISRFIE